MTRREVKLKVNVEGIVEKCKSIYSRYDADFLNTQCIKPSYLVILKDIFGGDSLEIESDHSKEEKERILDIIINDMSQFLIDNEYQESKMYVVGQALKSKDDNLIESKSIELINKFMKPNPFIYRPEHGIYRKIAMNESFEPLYPDDDSPYLSTGTSYTLEIDDTKLQNALQLSEENLRKKYFTYANYLLFLLEPRDDLKKYSSIKKHYTLEGLYDLKEKNVTFLDYGLGLIYDNNYTFERLIERIRRMEADSCERTSIEKEIKEAFIQEDLDIIISVIDNIKEITYEKNIYERMVRALDYMANNTTLLKETEGGPNILRIKADLSNFKQDYLSSDACLSEIIKEKSIKLYDEIRENKILFRRKTNENNERVGNLEEWENKNKNTLDPQTYNKILGEKKEEIQKAYISFDAFKKKLRSLQFDEKRENIEWESTSELQNHLRFLSELSPVQNEYLLTKIKEIAKLLDIKVVIDGVEPVKEMEVEEAPTGSFLKDIKPIKKGIAGLLTSAFVLTGVTITAFNQSSKSSTMTVADVHNVLNNNEALSYHEQQ
ncbi:hypothetical protein NEMIN01_1796 [Nematocida minor]|uniref:uncharacterized protein n=1 Tax=Nematocida minor TaxID=1912983 RepID=UPI00221F84A8|nr:uncharacterized protein NEMIN01_1796 [Nematocida minor]KAI5192048.1 hypothetical protein NEMIN01_1796 [Nematocida minor]